MNGYRARVGEHRRRLAEAAQIGERAAVPRFNWVVAAVEGVTDAARVPRRRKRPNADGQPMGQPTEQQTGQPNQRTGPGRRSSR